MKKITQKISIILSMALLLGLFSVPGTLNNQSSVSAAETEVEVYDMENVDNFHTGDLETSKSHALGSVNASMVEKTEPFTFKYFGAKYTYNWKNYGSDYYYSKLNAKEKALYNALMDMSMKYLNNQKGYKDFKKTSDGSTYYHTKLIGQYGLKRNDTLRVVHIFIYSNPQFYFYDHGNVTGYDEDYNPVIGLSVYSKFYKGTNRLTYTKKVNNVIQSWVKQIKKQSGYIKKINKAQELICKKVSYQSSTYDQSAYSVFCGNQTVCAGYASAFTIICEAAGIDTLILTSELVLLTNGKYYNASTLTNDWLYTNGLQIVKNYSHEWNMVKIHGYWYNMDVTWDDLDYSLDVNLDGTRDAYYCEYMLRNDRNFIYDYNYREGGSQESYLSHYPEDSWTHFGVPKAKLDTNPSVSDTNLYSKPGSLSTLNCTSKLTLKNTKKGVKVSWKKVSGAKYYIVQRKVGSGKWKTIKKKTTSLSFTDRSVKNKKTYYYRVTAMKTSSTPTNYCSAKKIKYKK